MSPQHARPMLTSKAACTRCLWTAKRSGDAAAAFLRRGWRVHACKADMMLLVSLVTSFHLNTHVEQHAGHQTL